MVVDAGLQKSICGVLTSYYVCYIQLVILKDWKQKIANYGNIHQYMFCKIDVLKILANVVKNICEKYDFDI